MGDTPIVDEGRIKRVSQHEVAERPAIEGVDIGDAAPDVAPVDQEHQHVVDAVAMDALRRRQPPLASARFDSELMRLDAPGRHGWGQAAEQ